jgi:hypothetical protein
LLSHLTGKAETHVDDRGIGDHSFHHFDKFHERDGVEKVQAQKPRTAPGSGHHFRNRQGRGVTGKDCLRLDDAIELGKHLPFALEIFRNGLDHQVAVGKVFESQGRLEPAENLGLLLRCNLAFLHKLG